MQQMFSEFGVVETISLIKILKEYKLKKYLSLFLELSYNSKNGLNGCGRIQMLMILKNLLLQDIIYFRMNNLLN